MNPGKDIEGRQAGPLEGIRIVEYGVFHAGPGATAILGDLGADVIKIETGKGDPERYWTTVGGMDMSMPDGQSVMHQVSNRNKKGICLDITHPKGRGILHRLVEQADVFLTNLRKSTKAKLGVDYATLSKVNPRIIHANVSGYGPEGAMSDLGAFDPLGMARSGMMFITGSEQPALLHLGVLDQATAIAASHAILSALFVRERHGIGQEVHVSLFGTGLWLTYPNLMLNNLLSLDPTIPSDRLKHSPLRNCFCCSDGKWILGTHHPEERYWPIFCEATGQSALLEDPRFLDDASRAANNEELVAHFDRVFATKTRDEWMEIFLPRKLMFCSVQRVDELESDPQAQENGYMVPFEHPTLGPVRIPGYPVHFSACEAGTRTAAPTLGQHTDSVLGDLGYTEEDIRALRGEGVVS